MGNIADNATIGEFADGANFPFIAISIDTCNDHAGIVSKFGNVVFCNFVVVAGINHAAICSRNFIELLSLVRVDGEDDALDVLGNTF